MGRQLLVVNLGTQEPRIRLGNRFLPLSDREGAVADYLTREFNLPRRDLGLFHAAGAVWEAWTNGKVPPGVRTWTEALRFPILSTCLEQYHPIDRLYLIATDSEDREKARAGDPQLNDTLNAAELAREFIQAEPHLIRKLTGFDAGSSIRVVKLHGNRLHLYRSAKRLLIASRFLDDVQPEDRVLICTSPGLPMVNAALLQYAMKRHRGQCFLFQVAEPDGELLLQGKHGQDTEAVAEAEIFDDYVTEMLGHLMARNQYEAAFQLVLRMSDTVAGLREKVLETCRLAERLWNLDPVPWVRPGDETGKCIFRARAGLRVAEAMFRANSVIEGIIRLGDVNAYLMDLTRALSVPGGIVLVTQNKVDIAPAWTEKGKIEDRDKNEIAPGARASSGDVLASMRNWPPPAFPSWMTFCRMDGLCKALRNRLVHRFIPPADEEIRDALNQNKSWRDLPGAAEVQDAGERVAGLIAVCRVMEAALTRLTQDAGVPGREDIPQFSVFQRQIQTDLSAREGG